MATEAFVGVGTVLAVGDAASPEVFTAIGKVRTIGGPQLSAEEIEVSALDSPSGFKEYITGLKDGGSVPLDLYWINSTQQQQLRDDVSGGTTRNYRITWPDSPNTVADFAAKVSEFSMNTEANAPVEASVSLRITGNVTWT